MTEWVEGEWQYKEAACRGVYKYFSGPSGAR